jgi:hypothetical protein
MSEVILIRGTRHVVWECRTCGCVSTVPEAMNDQLRAEGGYRSCPSGHQWGWTKETCEREQLRRERDRLKQDAARLEEEKRVAWLTANEQSERAKKAEAANRKLKKRASAGTCPCCSRSFSNMAEHMKRQHPEYVEENGAKVVPIKRPAVAS